MKSPGFRVNGCLACVLLRNIVHSDLAAGGCARSGSGDRSEERAVAMSRARHGVRFVVRDQPRPRSRSDLLLTICRVIRTRNGSPRANSGQQRTTL